MNKRTLMLSAATAVILSSPALAAALSQALGDAGVREALGRAGRQRAVADFSLEAMTRRYEQVLSGLLMDRRASKCPDRV